MPVDHEKDMLETVVQKMPSSKKTDLKEHYNRLPDTVMWWSAKNKFYHSEILKYYSFLIPPGSSILELGCGTGDLIGQLHPSLGVGVDVSERIIATAKERYPQVQFISSDVENFKSDQRFDYVVIAGTLGSVENIQALLKNVQKMTTSDTRIIISYYNELWGPVLRWAEKIGLKMPDIIFNWLSVDDIENFLYISGYQVIKKEFNILFPWPVPIINFLFNKILARLPIIRRLTLVHSVVARPDKAPERTSDLTCSVVLTCRDEEENIEELVTRIPQMGKHTEIIFVEGHSKDNTVGKIQEMIKKYPQKDIKLFKQKGIGQGDAFRLGFDEARGDLVCWLEADLTAPPEEIALFWDAYITGKGEYINGSRFIYQMEKDAMPFFNFLGNRFFGNLFTILLGQRFTDTLCGFKAISKKNYIKIRKQIDFFGDFDPFGDFQLIFGAVKNSLKVAEIPVHYQPRQYGESKAYGKTFLSFLKHAGLLLRMSWIAFVKFGMH